MSDMPITVRKHSSHVGFNFTASRGFGLRFGCKHYFMHRIFTIINFGILVGVIL
jgi:hypothetical protein